MAIGIAQCVGQQQGGGELAVGLQAFRARHMVTYCPGDALPGGVVLGGRAQAQQAAKIFHSPMRLSVPVHIKSMDHQGLAVVRYFRWGRGHDAAGHLHAQVLVQCHERQQAAGTFDDVPPGDDAGFGVHCQWHAGIALRIQKFWHHARHAAGGMFAHQICKGGFRVVALEQRGHFNRLGRFTEFSTRCRHLQAAHHVAPDHGQQGHRAGSDVRTKLLLQHLKQIALGQIHL